MSQEHVDALRSAYKQFARGDFSAYSERPDDFELVLAPEMPDATAIEVTRPADPGSGRGVESFDRLIVEAVDSSTLVTGTLVTN